MKICTGCKQEKDESEFYIDSRNGHPSAKCKACYSVLHKNYRINNSEKDKAIHKSYVARNKEKVYAYQKEWREINPEKTRELYRRYHATHKPKIDPSKRAEIDKRRNDKLKAENKPEFKRLLKALMERYDYKCLKCGSTENVGKDHIIPISVGGRTGDIMNIQPLCLSCNAIKSKHTEDYRPSYVFRSQGIGM